MNNSFNSIPEISFIEDKTIEDVQNEMIKDYQDKYNEITGENVELAKADPYRLILYACSLQYYQLLQYCDIQGKMNILKYTYGDYLDNIAILVGLKRKQGDKATTTIRFDLAAGRTSITSIPEGTRISTGDVFFLTTKYAEIAIGNTYVDVTAECSEIGKKGNGYLPGEISNLVDSVAYISSVSNITASDNGNDIENDDNFSERIYSAPSSFSVAGPEGAYEYFAKEYNSSIADAKAVSPSPKVVDVRIVLEGGELPNAELIEGVQEYLSNKTRRPLTDSVTVSAPTVINYNIDLTYYINESDQSIATTIQEKITSAIDAYKSWQDSKIGRDINPSYLSYLLMTSGAKRVDIRYPVYTSVESTSIAQNDAISAIYGGVEDD